jgi:hypothetical protein
VANAAARASCRRLLKQARVVPGQGIIFTSVDVIYDLLEPVMAKK